MKTMSTALGATMLVGLSSLAVPAFSADPAGPQKVFVCKYVGTPDVDERLQTGNNPIEVSVNAIPSFTGQEASALIGAEFADAQGRSVVIAVSAGPGGGQGDEPTIGNCPAPDGPVQPPVEPPVEPLVEPPVGPPVEPPVAPSVVPPVAPPVVPPVEPPVVPPVEPPVASPLVLDDSANDNAGNTGNNNDVANGGAEVLGEQASASNNAPAQANQQAHVTTSGGQRVPTVVNAGLTGDDVSQATILSSPAGVVLIGALMGLLAIGMRRTLARVGGGKA